jgi:hypothetical protein
MNNPTKKKELTSEFESLVRNGIEFLEKAISQLNSDPKHSVINFYTAVEIFLKAPLVREHWSLVVVDRDPNRQKYEAGDFISVTFEDACSRLSVSLGKTLGKPAKEAFDKVRRHRNRIVHFYHKGLSGKQHDEIKLEQAHAWYELNRFVTDTWKEAFEPFIDSFARMERSLVANNHYAQVKYESLKAKIEGMKKGGANITDCPYCKMNGYKVDEVIDQLFECRCMICFRGESQLKVTCPECGDEDQYVTAEEGFTCTECDHSVSGDNLLDLVDDSKRSYKDYYDAQTPANCGECQGYHTVCEYRDGYLCTNCLDYSESIGHCEWCNDPTTADTEDTYVTGCEFCDGYAGHHAND